MASLWMKRIPAESALTLANRAVYDIIVLDMSLPSRDGVWFIEELRSQGFETPIMVSSGARR